MKALLGGVVIASLSLLGAQWGMGPGPGISHAAGLNPCIVSSWPMTDGSGTDLADTSLHSNQLDVTSGSLTWASHAGFPGTTPAWSSTQATSHTPSVANFNGSTAFSVSAWINPSSVTGEQALLGNLHQTFGSFTGWELALEGNTIGFNLISSAPGSDFLGVTGTTTTLSTGSLYYLVVTYDGSKSPSGVKLYVNGTLQTNSVFRNSLSGSTASSLAVFAGAREANGAPYTGVMAFGEVYNCVVTSTQVSNYYAGGPGIY
jgi:hypothetical protein